MTDSVGRPRATRQYSEDRRQELLAATMSCLARLGPRATTGREICRQAGVSHGLLRHYFANPENLLLETYQQLCDQSLARLEEELNSPSDNPWTTMERLFGVLFAEKWVNSDTMGAWIAFWNLVHCNQDFAQIQEAYRQKLLQLLDDALKHLPPNPGGLPREQSVAILAAVIGGLWLDFSLRPNRLSRDRALELCSQALQQIAPA